MSASACRLVSAIYYRNVSFAALLAAACVLAPVQAIHAQTAKEIPSWHDEADTHRASEVTAAHLARQETIEQRIASLHEELKITAAEAPQWEGVAQTMRDNEAAMRALAVDAKTKSAEAMTAPGDLRAYQKFAQAHVDGLNKMIASFDTLYGAMPDAQKKVADQVFATFGRNTGHARH